MAKFMFIVPPLAGHINPTISLGCELLKNNHEVAWVSFDPSLQDKLPAKGKLLLLESDVEDKEKERIKNEMLSLGKKSVYGLDSLKFLYDEVLIPMNTGILDGIKKLIDSYCPDIIINDHQIFAGAIAAIQKNIPYATSVTAPAAIKVNESLPMIYKWEGDQIIAFQKAAGIEGETRLDCSGLLTLVYTSKEFFGKSDLPDHYKFIGPAINNRNDKAIAFDWQYLQSVGNQPKILVSIGTTFDHELKQQFFKKVVEAFSDENITVVVISDPELFDEIPKNFMVYKRVPQLDLTPHIDAVICHAGHNTVIETLSHGKPLVVAPIAYDQSYVAGCVVDNNAGIRLNFNRFKAPQLREAVFSVLNTDKYIDGAKVIQKSFENSGGVAKAVVYLEDLLNN